MTISKFSQSKNRNLTRKNLLLEKKKFSTFFHLIPSIMCFLLFLESPLLAPSAPAPLWARLSQLLLGSPAVHFKQGSTSLVSQLSYYPQVLIHLCHCWISPPLALSQVGRGRKLKEDQSGSTIVGASAMRWTRESCLLLFLPLQTGSPTQRTPSPFDLLPSSAYVD